MKESPIKSALISVYHKENLEPILELLKANDVKIYSTGGTQNFIENLGINVTSVEDLTGYPSIFGGRVKTLHPKVFGGILHRRSHLSDQEESKEQGIPTIDLVIVDLYPFEATVESGAAHQEIIEKIDIGGISLIRAGAKNYQDVLIVSSMQQYKEAHEIIATSCSTTLEQRRRFAAYAFDISSGYDTAIFNYFNIEEDLPSLKVSHSGSKSLRYGENPHQKGAFFGSFNEMFDQLNGKEISYNNLIDIDAAISLIADFNDGIIFAILKHNNACGIANGSSVKEAYLKAFAADTLSAFGGVLVSNTNIDIEAAQEINKLFCEVIIAPGYEDSALELLKSKKNRIILIQKKPAETNKQFRSLLNGVIEQDRDTSVETEKYFEVATKIQPSSNEIDAMVFANKIVKHTKSNAIVLAKSGQMMASGVGQTSRIDAVNQAIDKAKKFGFDLTEAVMASDAFFPFPDSVEIAFKNGITGIIQPGGSVKDQESIDYCNENGMLMVFTGKRHFKH